MIHPASLYRLVEHLVAAQLERARFNLDETEEPSDAAKREQLIDFAGLYDLDLEDTATLYAIAAGAGLAPDTPTTDNRHAAGAGRYVLDRGLGEWYGHVTESGGGRAVIELDRNSADYPPAGRIVTLTGTRIL